MKKAVILGITGVTGNVLAHKLLDDDYFDEVISIHRRSAKIKHPKFKEYIVSDVIEDNFPNLEVDMLFCCVGTTQAKTPDRDTYKKIDYGIPIHAANWFVKQNGKTMITISALGADPASKIFYNRIKGEMERDVVKRDISNTYFMQPSLIAGDRKEKRTAEYLGKQLMKILNPFLIGSLKKYRSIKPEIIAEAMIHLAKYGYLKNRIPSDEIKQVAHDARDRT